MSPGSLVLDVGAASGTLGRLCRGETLRLKGIEPNPVWAEMARPFYQEMYVGKVETSPAEYLAGVNAVVLADVLEHLPDPKTTLDSLVEEQAPGCWFILSVPNIANLWIRLSLLFGHFDYSERGILDRTHLHFFTRSTFFDFLQKAGLEIKECVATPIPLDLVHPFFEQNAVGRWLHGVLATVTRWFPTLLGYQFVVKAIKAKDEDL
jgi:2-polyprenyl-3-methyl-5-hydroxy-6-metoxy-1,4-benzoquinol methylase